MLSSGLDALCDLAQRCAPSTHLPSLPPLSSQVPRSAADPFLRRDPEPMRVRPEFTSPTPSPVCREPSPVIPGVLGPHSPPSRASTAAGSASNSDNESAGGTTKLQSQQPQKNAHSKAARQLLAIKQPSGKVLQQTRCIVRPLIPIQKRGRKPIDKSNFKCQRCGITNTPEWRRGPEGRNTLCNACTSHSPTLS